MILTILALVVNHNWHPNAIEAIAPLVAAALISSAPALLQAGQGISQGIRAKKLGNMKSPMYTVPQPITDNVRAAQMAYAAGLPGQGRIENNIGQNTAAANQAIIQSQQSPAAMLAGISSVNQNANNAIADLGVNAAQYRASQLNSLMSARDALARYQDRQFEINKLRPFEQQMAAASALRGASQQNLHGAAQSAADNFSNLYVKKYEKEQNQLYGF